MGRYVVRDRVPVQCQRAVVLDAAAEGVIRSNTPVPDSWRLPALDVKANDHRLHAKIDFKHPAGSVSVDSDGDAQAAAVDRDGGAAGGVAAQLQLALRQSNRGARQ